MSGYASPGHNALPMLGFARGSEAALRERMGKHSHFANVGAALGKTVHFGILCLALVVGLPACGDNLIPFDPGSGPDGNTGNPDGSPDGSPDSSGDLPTVTATSPTDAATNQSVNRRVTATFSRAMDPATLTAATFTVKQGATTITGTVSYAGTTATFVPAAPLSLSLVYTATITTGAADTLGAALASDYVWTFTTGACSHAPVVLLSAGTFGVLAGSTVTSTGATSVTGDLGVSPGTAVTGFPPGNVIGTMHAGDPTSAQATADLTTAFNDATARTLCPVSVAGNLGGMTLAPGLYKSTSSLEITSGDLTLDAQGDGDAVFIFQMASTLTTTVGRQVILAGGAKSTNVFWQVGTSVTLGTASVFHGTIMADQAITMGTGATLNGRVLARIAGVSLDTNVIVIPAP